jgi:hypothetical protein
MLEPKKQRPILHFVTRVLVIDTGMFAVVGAICWFGGWRSWEAFSDGLIYASGAVLAFAAFSAYGGWQQTGSFTYQYGSTVNPDDGHTRARRTYADRNAGFLFVLQVGVICALPLAVAAVIQFGLV